MTRLSVPWITFPLRETLRRLRNGNTGTADPITDAGQVTPAWLTRALKKAGVLSGGKVARIRQTSFSSVTSSISRLEVRYSDNAPEDAPRRLFLKCFVPDDSPTGLVEEQLIDSGRREVEFYNVVAGHMTAMSAVPVVRCYDARYSPATPSSHTARGRVGNPLRTPGTDQLRAHASSRRCARAFKRSGGKTLDSDGVGEVPTKRSCRAMENSRRSSPLWTFGCRL